MRPLLMLIALLLIMHVPAYARPVSYQGGWTVMSMNNTDTQSLHLHYSPTAKNSIGARTELWERRNLSLYSAQYNYLLKRWNKRHSQSNIYFKSGLGLGVTTVANSATVFTGLAADWENRRLYTSYANRYIDSGQNGYFYRQNMRIGIAPYIANYGQLHTWLMLQANHWQDTEETITLSPIIRLFTGAHLVEIGMMNDNSLIANYVYRY